MNMRSLSFVLILIFSINTQSEEINLWKGFNYDMSPSEVLDEIAKTEHQGYNSTLIGFKPTINRKIQKNKNYAVTVEGYCSIYANNKIAVLGNSSFIQWCFDKPFSRKKIDNSAKLKFIEVMFQVHLGDTRSKITSTYKQIYPYDWFNSLKVEDHLLSNCDSHYGVTFVDRNENVFIAHEQRRGSTGIDPWIMFVKKDEMIDSLLNECMSTINSIQNSSDL